MTPIRHFVDSQTVADNNLGLDGKDIVVNFDAGTYRENEQLI